MPTIPASITRRALVDEPLAQPPRHLRRLQPHVSPEPDPQLARLLAAQLAEHPREGAADQVVDLAIHLLAVEAADVVGLEDRLGDLHAQSNAPFNAS